MARNTTVRGYSTIEIFSVQTSPSMQRKCLPATWKYLQRSVGGVITGRVAFTANQTTIKENLIDNCFCDQRISKIVEYFTHVIFWL